MYRGNYDEAGSSSTQDTGGLYCEKIGGWRLLLKDGNLELMVMKVPWKGRKTWSLHSRQAMDQGQTKLFQWKSRKISKESPSCPQRYSNVGVSSQNGKPNNTRRWSASCDNIFFRPLTVAFYISSVSIRAVALFNLLCSFLRLSQTSRICFRRTIAKEKENTPYVDHSTPLEDINPGTYRLKPSPQIWSLDYLLRSTYLHNKKNRYYSRTFEQDFCLC